MINGVVPVNGEQPKDGSEKRSVLVVDDNPSIQRLLKYMLKTEYEVKLASGVDEALQLAQERVFDALVLDINLGEPRTGIDLLQLLRQMPAYREVPAVACTASVGGRASALEAGFDEYVDKPFTKAQIQDALTRVLRSSRRLVARDERRTRAPDRHANTRVAGGTCMQQTRDPERPRVTPYSRQLQAS